MTKEQVELKVVEYAKSVGWDEEKVAEFILDTDGGEYDSLEGEWSNDKAKYIIQKYKPKQGRPKSDKTITPGLRIDADKWKSVSAKHKGKINKMFNDWIDTL